MRMAIIAIIISSAAKGNNSKGSCILVQKLENWRDCKKVGIFQF
jgi:hypothetical protein